MTVVTKTYRDNYAEIVWAQIVPAAPRVPRSNAAPYVISDTMEHTWHPATGEMIDSKSKFRRRTKDTGCEEMGNDVPSAKSWSTVPKPGPDIRRAIEQLRDR